MPQNTRISTGRDFQIKFVNVDDLTDCLQEIENYVISFNLQVKANDVTRININFALGPIVRGIKTCEDKKSYLESLIKRMSPSEMTLTNKSFNTQRRHNTYVQSCEFLISAIVMVAADFDIVNEYYKSIDTLISEVTIPFVMTTVKMISQCDYSREYPENI